MGVYSGDAIQSLNSNLWNDTTKAINLEIPLCQQISEKMCRKNGATLLYMQEKKLKCIRNS